MEVEEFLDKDVALHTITAQTHIYSHEHYKQQSGITEQRE